MADMNGPTQIDGDWMMKNYPSMDPTHPKWQKTIDSEQAKMNLAFKSKNNTIFLGLGQGAIRSGED